MKRRWLIIYGTSAVTFGALSIAAASDGLIVLAVAMAVVSLADAFRCGLEAAKP